MPAAVKTRFLEKIKGYFNLCSALNQLINLGQRIYGYANFRPFFLQFGSNMARACTDQSNIISGLAGFC